MEKILHFEKECNEGGWEKWNNINESWKEQQKKELDKLA